MQILQVIKSGKMSPENKKWQVIRIPLRSKESSCWHTFSAKWNNLFFAKGSDGLGSGCLYYQRQAIEELGPWESWDPSCLLWQLCRCQPDTLTGSRLASSVNQPVRHISRRNQPVLHQKFIDTDTFLQSTLGHQAGFPACVLSENGTNYYSGGMTARGASCGLFEPHNWSSKYKKSR